MRTGEMPRNRTRYIGALLLSLVMAGCLPTAEEQVGLQVALVNAPAEERIAFLADGVQEETLSLARCCAFEFVRAAPVRFQETHRDMFGSRAAPQAAAIARNLGAEVAVMVSAPRFERVVEPTEDGREVRGIVRVQASAVDASTGRNLGSVGSLTFRRSRFVAGSEPLPSVEEDPIMVELTLEAAADMAPHLAALLDDIAGRQGRAQRK